MLNFVLSDQLIKLDEVLFRRLTEVSTSCVVYSWEDMEVLLTMYMPVGGSPAKISEIPSNVVTHV